MTQFSPTRGGEKSAIMEIGWQPTLSVMATTFGYGYE